MAGESDEVPDEVLASVDWSGVYVRLTAYAHARMCRTSMDEARRLAAESLGVLFDPRSKVTWDYEKEPDPLRCLGSIVNGKVRNHFRKKSRTYEVIADDVHAEPGASLTHLPPDQEARLIAADLRQKVLERVLDLSDGDELVQEIVVLADGGIIGAAEQAEELQESPPRIYEARRRFKRRIEIARQELEEL